MYTMSVLTVGIATACTSGAISFIIVTSKERMWLKTKKAEDLSYRAEELHLYLRQYYGNIRSTDAASTRLYDERPRMVLNRMICDLKVQVGIYFPHLDSQFANILSAISTTHDALEKAARADAEHFHLEVLDFACANMKASLDQLMHGLLVASGRREFLPQWLAMFRPRTPIGTVQSQQQAAA